MKNVKRKLAKILVVASIMVLAFTNYCFATEGTSGRGGLQSTTLVTGTERLLKDLTNWFMVLVPIVAVVLIIFFLIRKSAADEMDGKRWDNRIKTVIICAIGAVIASGLINVLIGYYQ